MKSKKKVKVGICEIARKSILQGYNFLKTFQAIKKVHPGTKFSKKCYYWFRNRLGNGSYDKFYGKKIKVPAIRS